jgi:metallo-beta-lactamase class B
MKRYLVPLFSTIVLLASGVVTVANAQGSKAAAQVHIDKAKAAAYRPGYPLTKLYETVCAPALSEKGPVEPNANEGGQTSPSLANRKVPPRSEWYTEPAKVFDNLYWLGSHGDAYSVPTVTGDSTWAVKTSDGIILIDTGYDYSAKELITDGLKKLGLDPTQIKYVVLSHNHGDRYFGAKYIQDTYHARIIMSEPDWTAMYKSNEPTELRPKKDMIATDGMKLTLGDTTLTLYITPGHTPGTVTTMVPLKDGNQTHLGVVWGGINPSLTRYGVRYYADWQTTFKTWSGSLARFLDIINKTGADTYLTIHPFYDNALEKIHAVQYRKPGDPHPLVNKDNLVRFLTILKECTDAQLARIASS